MKTNKDRAAITWDGDVLLFKHLPWYKRLIRTIKLQSRWDMEVYKLKKPYSSRELTKLRNLLVISADTNDENQAIINIVRHNTFADKPESILDIANNRYYERADKTVVPVYRTCE